MTSDLRVPALNVLVVGMHRSGTSAIAGALQTGGFYTGYADDLEFEPAIDNPDGYAERRDVVEFNDRLLESLGWRWDAVPASAPVSPLARDELVTEARQLVRDKLTGRGTWLVKDPRISVLLPWWRQILLDRFVALVAVRDLTEVAWSLAVRDGFSMELGAALWTAYHRHLVAGLDGLPVVAVDYAALTERPADVVPQVLDALHSAGVTASSFDVEQAVASIRPQLRRATSPAKSQPAALDVERAARLSRGFLPSGTVASFDRFHFELDDPDRWDTEILAEHGRLRDVQDETKRALAEVHSAHQQTATARIAADEARAQISNLRQQFITASAERDASLATIQDLRAAANESEETIANLREQLASADARHEADEQTMRDLRSAISADEEAIDDLRRAISADEQAIDELQSEAGELQEKLSAAAAEQADNAAALQGPVGVNGSPRRRGLKPSLRRLHGRLPWYLRSNPLFDRAWYVALYPDVRSARLGAYWHYHRHGWREGRDPNPYFDTDWYLRRYPDVAARGLEPLEHYLRFGGREGRDPGPRFDAQRYLRANPDVADAGNNPLLHYLRHGQREGRLALPLAGDPPAVLEIEHLQAPPLPPAAAAAPRELDDSIRHLPDKAGIVIAGDDGLTMMAGAANGGQRRTRPPTGTPVSARSAIVQLEAARWQSADYFVLSRTAWWWMDHFPELASHLDGWYLPVPQDSSSRIWDLRQPGPWVGLDELVGRVAAGSDAPPSVLVWRSDRDLEKVLPDCRVFRPGSDASPLPYLDGTIDIVALGDPTEDALREARRVASAGVVDVSSDAPSVVWQAATAAVARSAVSIGLLVSRRQAPSERWLRLFAQDLPRSIEAEILLVGPEQAAADHSRSAPFDYTAVPVRGDLSEFELIDSAVRAARNEAVVLLDTGANPVPGSIAALLRVLEMNANVALVSAAQADSAGRCVESEQRQARTAEDIGAPARNITQQVDHGDLTLAALRKEPYLAARGAMSAGGPATSVALGEQLRQLNKRWISTTDAIAIVAQDQ